MVRIVIDTDVFVNHLRGVKKARTFLKKVETGKIEGFFSTITEAELFSGRRVDSPSEQRKIGKLLGILKRVEVDSKIARKAGGIRRRYDVLLPDAIIAATAYYKKARIATKNIKHFEPIKEIKLETY
ncbi:MAG: type II toxin-antitoxin system VapC family toxin [Candidatus Hydrothermarchaeales archaeon]